jgi:hypothetical protein
MSRKYLTTYLNDHLAGSVGVVKILELLAEEFPDSRTQLAGLRTDIEADRQELKTLMYRLGVPERRLRKSGGWIAEKLTEIKLTADDPAGGALRQLEGLETIALGIDGKLALWWALNAAADVTPELRGVDYERLVQRAMDQRNRVEVLRCNAARSALAPETSGTSRRAA